MRTQDFVENVRSWACFPRASIIVRKKINISYRRKTCFEFDFGWKAVGLKKKKGTKKNKKSQKICLTFLIGRTASLHHPLRTSSPSHPSPPHSSSPPLISPLCFTSPLLACPLLLPAICLSNMSVPSQLGAFPGKQTSNTVPPQLNGPRFCFCHSCNMRQDKSKGSVGEVGPGVGVGGWEVFFRVAWTTCLRNLSLDG